MAENSQETESIMVYKKEDNTFAAIKKLYAAEYSAAGSNKRSDEEETMLISQYNISIYRDTNFTL